MNICLKIRKSNANFREKSDSYPNRSATNKKELSIAENELFLAVKNGFLSFGNATQEPD